MYRDEYKRLNNNPLDQAFFLQDIIYDDKAKAIEFKDELYEYLFHEGDPSSFREIGIWGLINILKIEDENVRRRAALCLLDIHTIKQKKICLKVLYKIVFSEAENINLRIFLFSLMLNFFGLSSYEIETRNIIPGFIGGDDFFRKNILVFKDEIDEIKKIIM